MTVTHMTDRLGRSRPVGSVPSMTGVTFPASTSSLRATRSLWFWNLIDGRSCWRTNIDVTMALMTVPMAPPEWPPPFGCSFPVGVSARRVCDNEWLPTLSRMKS